MCGISLFKQQQSDKTLEFNVHEQQRVEAVRQTADGPLSGERSYDPETAASSQTADRQII